MQPEDDPEARIRELERSLSDAARTSQLGAGYNGSGGQHTPTPWPTDGAPYPEVQRRGFRPWWLMLALIAVALVMLGAGVAFFSATMATREGSVTSVPGRPTVAGGGGSLDRTPGGHPTTSPGESMPTATPIEPTTPPPGERVTVSGVDESRRIDCNASFVSVSGVDNTVTITGHCASVTVSGVRNSVTVDSADTISASGFNNRITYHSGSPRIDSFGGTNVVEQG